METLMIAPDVEKDGVAKYTDFLLDELEEVVDVEKFGLEGALSLRRAISMAWNTSGYDVAHVQFTPEYWGNLFGYFWGLYMIPFLLLARARTVLTVHEYDFDHPNPIVYLIQKLKFRLIYTLADRIIVHNEYGEDYIHDISPRARIKVIPQGILDVDIPEEELDIDGNVILIFGFIRRDKDYETVFDAMDELPENYHLLVAGSARSEEDERYEEELKQEVQQRGLNDRVTFYGYVPENEVGKVFNTADISLLPYQSSSGSAVLAMSLAYEVPVLMSDIAIAREIGIKVFDSEKELVQKIEEIQRDEHYLESIRELKSERLWGKVAGRTSEVYEESV